jgi:hypothetical protein
MFAGKEGGQRQKGRGGQNEMLAGGEGGQKYKGGGGQEYKIGGGQDKNNYLHEGGGQVYIDKRGQILIFVGSRGTSI